MSAKVTLLLFLAALMLTSLAALTSLGRAQGLLERRQQQLQRYDALLNGTTPHKE